MIPAVTYFYQTDFCSPCFDEVCSKCSTGLDGIANSEEVRISGSPVCAKPPTGAKAPSRGTTVATLTLEPGYFRTSNESNDVRECYNENACRGGSDPDEYCTSGYTGPCETALGTGFSIDVPYYMSCGTWCKSPDQLNLALLRPSINIGFFLYQCIFLGLRLTSISVAYYRPPLQTVRFVLKDLRRWVPSAVANAPR